MDFKSIDNPLARSFNDRFVTYDENQLSFNESEGIYEVDEDGNGSKDFSFGNPDFSFVQFRSNLVLRWEYIPGSEIFLVWSQGISGSADPNESLFGGIRSQILDQRPWCVHDYTVRIPPGQACDSVQISAGVQRARQFADGLFSFAQNSEVDSGV